MANAHSHDGHDVGHGSVKSYAIVLLVGLSLWIMFSIHTNMMAH